MLRVGILDPPLIDTLTSLLVPFQALPLPSASSEYALSLHDIHYVMSARDLDLPDTPASANPALIMADPNFDFPNPETTVGATEPIIRNEAGKLSNVVSLCEAQRIQIMNNEHPYFWAAFSLRGQQK